MTIPHRIAYERWRAAVLPHSLEEQFELDALVYGTACARVDTTGRIERVHPLDAARLELATRCERNARKRQRRARRGK